MSKKMYREFEDMNQSGYDRGKPKRIMVVIYPNQLEWMDKISETLSQSKRQTFLECFSCYIGEFKQSMQKETR